jgi:uncharacterized short protein YbdD (DUF466 family)
MSPTARTSHAGVLKRAWSWLRQVTGDAAYDNYLRHAMRHSDGQRSLTRAEFYRESLRRRYSTVSRCC